MGKSVLVSIPHRYAKNEQGERRFKNEGYVSIPHRYAKNAEYIRLKTLAGDVSIPHRYAKNRDTLVTRETSPRFQFLIGTLKTLLPLYSGNPLVSFNSS